MQSTFKRLAFLSVFIFTQFSLNATFDEIDNFPERIYVDSENILFHEKSIFVNFDDSLLRVESIFSDPEGLYIQKPQVGSFIFVCKECGLPYDISEQYYRCPHNRIR